MGWHFDRVHSCFKFSTAADNWSAEYEFVSLHLVGGKWHGCSLGFLLIGGCGQDSFCKFYDKFYVSVNICILA